MGNPSMKEIFVMTYLTARARFSMKMVTHTSDHLRRERRMDKESFHIARLETDMKASFARINAMGSGR